MKNLAILIAATALIAGAPAFADDAHHRATDQPTPAAKVVPKAAQPAKSTDTAAVMGQMKKMQEQMNKLRAATDPKARETLLAEHMQTMQQTMGTMHGADGSTTCGRMMASGCNHTAAAQPRSPNMDMMQMMMQQMIEHQQAMQAPVK